MLTDHIRPIYVARRHSVGCLQSCVRRGDECEYHPGGVMIDAVNSSTCAALSRITMRGVHLRCQMSNSDRNRRLRQVLAMVSLPLLAVVAFIVWRTPQIRVWRVSRLT